MQRSPQYKKSVPTDTLGFRTTQITKPKMIDELNADLRLGGMILHCKETIAELRTFVRDEKKMHGSPYDDRTISLAIANQMLAHVWLPEYVVDREPPPGSIGHWERQLFGESFSDLIKDPKSKKHVDRKPFGQNAVRNR
jgi:hypothetical protein